MADEKNQLDLERRNTGSQVNETYFLEHLRAFGKNCIRKPNFEFPTADEFEKMQDKAEVHLKSVIVLSDELTGIMRHIVCTLSNGLQSKIDLPFAHESKLKLREELLQVPEKADTATAQYTKNDLIKSIAFNEDEPHQGLVKLSAEQTIVGIYACKVERHAFFRNLGIIVKTKKVESKNQSRRKSLSKDLTNSFLVKDEDESSDKKYSNLLKTDEN